MAKVQFLFDFGSPNAYLAHKVIPGIEARTGARFTYTPALLGGIFKATGNQSPAQAFAGIPLKLAYEAKETRRFVKKHGIADYATNPHFPVNSLKMDDPAVIRQAFADAGLPADKLIELMGDPAVKARLIENTEAAVAKGVFGSPSFLVGDELFFGKDRLRDVEEEIAAGAPA